MLSGKMDLVRVLPICDIASWRRRDYCYVNRKGTEVGVTERRTILHSDMNAFYASVEMMLDPSLRGKAVAVCGSTEDRHGIVLANLVGIIDSDYHGEILVGLWNRSQKTFIVHPGDRICQMIFMPVTQVGLRVVEAFSTTSERGEGGLGHTGL